jgi:hypothetical protein
LSVFPSLSVSLVRRTALKDVGNDLHKPLITAGVVDPDRNVLQARRFACADTARIAVFFGRPGAVPGGRRGHGQHRTETRTPVKHITPTPLMGASCDTDGKITRAAGPPPRAPRVT